MSAGKGSGRRKGSDDLLYRKNFPEIKGMNHKKSSEEEEFEKTFMGKTAAEEAPLSGKYFIGEAQPCR